MGFFIYLLVLGIILTLEIYPTVCQIKPKPYPKRDVEPYLAQSGSPYGDNVNSPQPTPPYYETLWGASSNPPVVTQCQFIFPITITIGNLNITDPISVEFSCNQNLINGTSQINTQYGLLSISNSATILPVCNAFTKILNSISPTAIQTYTYTNLTYYVTGEVIQSLLPYFTSSEYSINGTNPYDWLSLHVYSETWYNLPSVFNLAPLFNTTITLPIIYKVFLPEYILPKNIVIGTKNEHYYVDGFNITIADLSNTTVNSKSLMWIPPKTGLAGFLPVITPVYQMKVVPYYNNVTAIFNKAAVTWGYTNIPYTVTPARVIPPTKLPVELEKNCSNNFVFYYPTAPYSLGAVIKNSSFPGDLTYLQKNNSRSLFQRNTLQTYSFFNKYIVMNAPNITGILNNTGPPFAIIENNFIGGCFYNGTYPLVPSIDNHGFIYTGYCSSQIFNDSVKYETPYYPPPLDFKGYFQSALDQPGLITNILQTVSYIESGIPGQNKNDYYKRIVGQYPGVSIISQLFYGIFIQGPRIIWPTSYFFNPTKTITPSGSFYAISQQYIERMYGSYNTLGAGSGCRGARFVPLPVEMTDVSVKWQCYTTKKPVTQIYGATTLKDQAFELCMNITKDSPLVNCVLNETQIPYTLQNSSSTTTLWSTNITKGHYSETTPLLFIQNTTTPMTVYGYSEIGWWVESITYPNNYPQWFLKAQTCAYLSELPMFPTSIPQVFLIESVVNPWDHIQSSHYFGTIPFLNTNKTFSVQIQINDSNFFTDLQTMIIFISYLVCDGYNTIKLTTIPNKLQASYMIPPNKVTISAIIKPYSLFADQNINCFIAFYAIPSSMNTSINPISFGSLANQIPTSPPKGIGQFLYYISADMPPQIGTVKVLSPNVNSSSISDTNYIWISQLAFPTQVQSSFFPTIGLIASSDPIISSSSKILILGDSLQLLQQSIRLPSIVPIWYIFVRGLTPSNSGCLIPCDISVKQNYITPYCTYNNTNIGPICPSVQIKMNSYDSNQQIQDLIAVATHEITYLNLIDALQIGIALFSQPITQNLVWDTYYDILFKMLIEEQQTPTAADFSASKLMVFNIINLILQTAYDNPESNIDTLRPFSTIANNTLNAECANNPGFKFLLLETIDLLAATNGWNFLNDNKQYQRILFYLTQAVGNRLSFFSGPDDSFQWLGPKSNLQFNSQTISPIQLESGIKVGSLKIPSMKLINTIKYHLIQSIFMQMNPKFYDEGYVYSYWIPSCPNNTLTFAVTTIPSTAISNIINNVAPTNKYVEITVASVAVYVCSIDYTISNLPSPVSFTVELNLAVPTNTTQLQCAILLDNYWSTQQCETYQINSSSILSEVKIQCQCFAIGEYALVGNISLAQKLPIIVNPWYGFSNKLKNILPNITNLTNQVSRTHSGFIYIEGESSIPAISKDTNTIGKAGKFVSSLRNTDNNKTIVLGINEEQVDTAKGTTIEYDFMYSWEPSPNSNITTFKS
ncbi:hypothetical protein ACR3K2_33120 [Cryptosporidium serpentis]